MSLEFREEITGSIELANEGIEELRRPCAKFKIDAALVGLVEDVKTVSIEILIGPHGIYAFRVGSVDGSNPSGDYTIVNISTHSLVVIEIFEEG
jgi:hypothetical protein